MRLESKSRFKTNKMAGNYRKRPYGMLLLLLALCAALLSVVLLHKMRERRVFSLLLQDRDQQLLALELILQKERENTIVTKKKLEVFKAKTISLGSEKAELSNKLIETESTISYLKRKQKELHAALEEKQNQIKGLTEKAAEATASNIQITTLAELLKGREAKIEEMMHHLLSLQPSKNIAAETSIDSRNGNVLNYKKENVTSEYVQLEERSTTGGESTIIEAKQVYTGNETASNQHKDIPEEETWVTLPTKVEEEGLKNATRSSVDQTAGLSGDNQLERLEVSQRSEDSVQSKETDQESNVEVKEQALESTNGKQIDSADAGNGKVGENSDEIEGKKHVPENGSAEKLQNPQNGYEQQITSAGLMVAGKNEDAKMRPGRGRRTKTKSRRRQRVSKEKELEKNNSLHFEISQNDENQVRKKESTDTNKEEVYRKDTDFSDSQLSMLETSQITGNSIVRDGREDGDASKRKEQMLLPQHESMETVAHSHDNEVSGTSLESKEFLRDDDGIGVRYDTGDKSELDDKNKDSVSNSSNVEMPDDSQEKTQNPEGGEGLQDHEEDSLDETAQKGEEQEMTSTDGKQEKSDDPHENGDENKSDDDEGRIIAHSINNNKSDAEGQDGIVTVNTISDPGQTEANSNTDDHQSKTTEKKNETANSSDTSDAKDDEDKGIKENAENNSSDNIAEF
ncbi:dentin sialophosphoprotein-like [Phoenix dactylifera]|uniref:Dentin sialophosphoprotein-like n=1 Tax=Phoenix dactylifera TaxID=42345 RepID=A0A8B7CT84_PHODC|nr:dentin sialophosphoprotein-like [Phoenix dactylifera]